MPKHKKSQPHEEDDSDSDDTADTEASTDDEKSDSDDDEVPELVEVAEGGEDDEDDEEEEEEEGTPRDYYHIHDDADDLERAGNYTPDALLCGSVRGSRRSASAASVLFTITTCRDGGCTVAGAKNITSTTRSTLTHPCV